MRMWNWLAVSPMKRAFWMQASIGALCWSRSAWNSLFQTWSPASSTEAGSSATAAAAGAAAGTAGGTVDGMLAAGAAEAGWTRPAPAVACLSRAVTSASAASSLAMRASSAGLRATACCTWPAGCSSLSPCEASSGRQSSISATSTVMRGCGDHFISVIASCRRAIMRGRTSGTKSLPCCCRTSCGSA